MKWADMTSRERDALVAEKVMGWRSIAYRSGCEGDTNSEFHGFPPQQYVSVRVPNYTTDISAAWEVFDKAQEHCDFGAIQHKGFGDVGYHCQFVTMTPNGEHLAREVFAEADTAPESICKAALKLVGVNVE